jgi:hypothetical protein
VGTSEAFKDRTISVKDKSSKIRTWVKALSTNASAVGPPYFSFSSF